MGPLLLSVIDPITLYFREPPSGGMKPLGQWSWLGLWGEVQLIEVVRDFTLLVYHLYSSSQPGESEINLKGCNNYQGKKIIFLIFFLYKKN